MYGSTREQVYAGPVETVHEGPVHGSYTIEKSMTPGIYLLQVAVAGADRNGKPFRGTAEVDFGVRQ